MRRMMLLAILVLLGGCPANTASDTRLVVNDKLRLACRSMDDLFIETALQALESDRLAGILQRDHEVGLANVCFYGTIVVPSVQTECFECGLAISAQVYGN